MSKARADGTKRRAATARRRQQMGRWRTPHRHHNSSRLAAQQEQGRGRAERASATGRSRVGDVDGVEVGAKQHEEDEQRAEATGRQRRDRQHQDHGDRNLVLMTWKSW